MPRADLIELRYGTVAAWAAANPVLKLAEPGLTDTGVLKFGDGVTAWLALPSFSGGGGSPTGPAGGDLAGTYPNPTIASTTLQALIANGAPGVTGLALLLAGTATAARTTLSAQLANAILDTLVSNGAPGTAGLALLLAANAGAARTTISAQLANAILDTLVSNGAPGTTGLALLLAANAAAGRTTLSAQLASSILDTLVSNGAPGTTGLALLLTSSAASALSTIGASAATPTIGSALGTTGTVNLDMAALNDTVQTISQTGALTLTTSNRSAGRHVSVKITNGTGGALGLTLPAWIPLSSAFPTSIPAGKTCVVSVQFVDSTDAAAYAAAPTQP